MLVEKSFDTTKVVLNYAEGPINGPPLVLLHDITCRWQNFNSIINQFINRWHIYSLDFRGHGKSGRTPNKYGLRYHYNDTVKFITQIVREPSVVLGHSLGGRIALLLAANNPYITKAIILGDVSLNFRSEVERLRTFFLGLSEILEKNRTEKEIHDAYRSYIDEPETLLLLVKNFTMLDPELPASITDNLVDPDDPESYVYGYKPDELMTDVRCPILLLQAENGSMSNEDVAKALAVLKDGYHVKLIGLNHLLHLQDSAPIIKAVNAFLEYIR
jgi:pimeloyl-ACP methyl ester carboxylesterase